ncbi:hypothetical protein MRB53_038783 [Persea americana]|nr:hypothetical protein MRB53_038783 [Persea americana]
MSKKQCNSRCHRRRPFMPTFSSSNPRPEAQDRMEKIKTAVLNAIKNSAGRSPRRRCGMKVYRAVQCRHPHSMTDFLSSIDSNKVSMGEEKEFWRWTARLYTPWPRTPPGVKGSSYGSALISIG